MRRISVQKVSYLSIIFILLSLFYAVNSAWAWTEPVELNHFPVNHNVKGLVLGKTLHIVNIGSPPGVIFYMSSWNNGFSWTAPIMPADTFYRQGILPDIAADSSGSLHIVWRGWNSGDPAHSQIFHIASTNGGRFWGPRRQRLFFNDFYVDYPRIEAKGDSLFVLCRADFYMLFVRSFDGGLTWRDSTVLDSIGNLTYPPTLLYSNGRVHAVYSVIDAGDTTGFEVFTRHSDDFGFSWSQEVALSTIESPPQIVDSQWPSAYADAEGHIIVCWFDYKYGSYCGTTGDILARISTDNGESWLPESRLTNTQSANASSCLIVGNMLYAVWDDTWPNGCNYPKIKYSYSSDWGINWTSPEVITGPEVRREQMPLLLYNIQGHDTLFHCFFDIINQDVFTTRYTRNIPFLTDRLPLPFNQPEMLTIKIAPLDYNTKTIISYESQKGGDITFEIYDIGGRKIWSKEAYGKEGSLIWDGSTQGGARVCSGVYFLRARKEETEKTAKILITR